MLELISAVSKEDKGSADAYENCSSEWRVDGTGDEMCSDGESPGALAPTV